jgi:hypothetical protein
VLQHHKFHAKQQAVNHSSLFPKHVPAGQGLLVYLLCVPPCLQALLSLPCLAQDLTSSSLQKLNLATDSVTTALQTCLQQQQASR